MIMLVKSIHHMSRIVRKPVTAKLISAFVFATRIVQFLFYLNPKFQASSSFLSLYRPVCVGPVRKPRRPVFSRRGSYMGLTALGEGKIGTDMWRKLELVSKFNIQSSFGWNVFVIIACAEKTNNLGFRLGPTQTGLYSHRSRLEA